MSVNFINQSFIDQIRRKRDPLAWIPENSFIADRDYFGNDTSYTYTPQEVFSSPKTKLPKKSAHVFANTYKETNHRESVTGELSINPSEAEKVQLSITEPLALAEVVNVIDGSNLESGGKEAEAKASIAIITPSIVTETLQITELTESSIERQPVPGKAVEKPKEARQQVVKQKAIVPHVAEEEADMLEQESLKLAKKLIEEERLEELKKVELEQQSLTLAMKLAEEEAEQLRLKLKTHTKSSKKGNVSSNDKSDKSAIQLQREEEARQKLKAERLKAALELLAEQLEERLAKLEQERLVREQLERENAAKVLEEEKRKAELEKQQQAELLVQQAEEERLAREQLERLDREAEEERLAKLEEEAGYQIMSTTHELLAAYRLEVKVREKLAILKEEELVKTELEEEATALLELATTPISIKNWLAKPDLFTTMKLVTTELEEEAEALTVDYHLTVERLEKELKEAIAEAKLATAKLEQARLSLNDTKITELEKITQNSIKEGETVLKDEQTERFLELAEDLKALASGLFSTAAAYEDPRNIDAIKAAIKLRMEKEEAEQQAEIFVPVKVAPVKESLSWFEKLKNFFTPTVSKDPEIELSTFSFSSGLSGKLNDPDEFHNFHDNHLDELHIPVQEDVY